MATTTRSRISGTIERARRGLIDLLDRLGLADAVRAFWSRVSPSPRIRRDGRDVRNIELVMAATVGRADVVVDVGANIGTISRLAVRVAPDAQHLLFEPLPELAERLRTDFPTCAVHETALSDRQGEATFVRVVERPTRSGLRPGQVKSGMRTSEMVIQTTTLDEVLGDVAPRLVKVDVEGTELEVLRGSDQTLRRARPVVVFEHQPDESDLAETAELHSYLAGHGYRLYDIDGTGPFTLDEFVDTCRRGAIWNYLAVPAER